MDKKSIQQTKRLFTFVLALGILLTSLPVHAQNVRVTIDMRDAPMENVMNEIEEQTRFLFLANQDVDVKQKVSVTIRSRSLSDALAQMVRGTDVGWQMRGTNIVLSRKQVDDDKRVVVSGTVRDAQGNAAIGVSVVVKGTIIGTSSDANGAFSLRVPAPARNAVLVFN